MEGLRIITIDRNCSSEISNRRCHHPRIGRAQGEDKKPQNYGLSLNQSRATLQRPVTQKEGQANDWNYTKPLLDPLLDAEGNDEKYTWFLSYCSHFPFFPFPSLKPSTIVSHWPNLSGSQEPGSLWNVAFKRKARNGSGSTQANDNHRGLLLCFHKSIFKRFKPGLDIFWIIKESFFS